MTTLQEGAQRIASQLLATINTVHATGKWPVNTLPLMREAAQALVNEPQAEPATGKESLTPQQAQQAQGVPPDRVFQLADAHAEESYENGDRRFDRGGLIQFAKELLAAAPQAEPQPEREPLTDGQQFCYCGDEISLQGVSGGAAPEGLYGSVTIKVGGEFVVYSKHTQAAADVSAERKRQVSVEGWTSSHDAQHADGSLALAAACYACNAATWAGRAASIPADDYVKFAEPGFRWPWHQKWWKPKSQRRDLVRAGALILAEIERLDRLAGIGTKGGGTK